jgi:hypothetical protein
MINPKTDEFCCWFLFNKLYDLFNLSYDLFNPPALIFILTGAACGRENKGWLPPGSGIDCPTPLD